MFHLLLYTLFAIKTYDYEQDFHFFFYKTKPNAVDKTFGGGGGGGQYFLKESEEDVQKIQ